MPQDLDGFSFEPEGNGVPVYYWSANRHLVHYDGPLDVAVDLGAHIGCFSLLAARKGAHLVLAYEPNPISFEYLVNNAINNGFWGRIVPVPLAVTRDGGKRIFNCIFEGNTGGSTFFGEGQHKLAVQTQSFRNVLDSLTHVDYLKIDIEAGEYEILGRTDETRALLKKVRYLDLEIHGLDSNCEVETFNTYTMQSGYAKEMIDFLRFCGFNGTVHPDVLKEHGPHAFASYNDNFSGD